MIQRGATPYIYGDTMRLVKYSSTRRVKKVGTGSLGVYVGSFFGDPHAGDILEIEAYCVEEPRRVFQSTKKIIRKGSSICIILDSDWGFVVGDLVVIKYSYPEKEDYDDS